MSYVARVAAMHACIVFEFEVMDDYDQRGSFVQIHV
jgi:hypothetical protein